MVTIYLEEHEFIQLEEEDHADDPDDCDPELTLEIRDAENI